MLDFPYQPDTKGFYFPVINFLVYHQNRFEKTSALIDSGATVSVFKTDLAEQLGLKIENGKEIFLGGVGGHN